MLVILAIACSLFSVTARRTTEALDVGGSSASREASPAVGRRWISQIIADAEMGFDMRVNVSGDCERDFDIYRRHVQNQTVWAVRMAESSEWPRIGLFSGATAHLGHYKECLRSRGPLGIKGQYCIAQASYDFTTVGADQQAPAWPQWPDEGASAWKVIKMHEESPYRKPRRLLLWAMCIPSSCTAEDLRTSLNRTLYPAFETQEMEITVQVNPLLCRVEGAALPPAYRDNSISDISQVIGWLLLLVALSTIYDLTLGSNREKYGLWSKLIDCFSAVRNFKSLTQDSPSDTYSFLHFLKILFMGVIIYGHGMVAYYAYPNFETEEMETNFRPGSMVLLTPVAINGFFMISGFLRAFQFNFSPRDDNSVPFLARSLAMKWLRMVPASGLLILSSFFILPRLDEGPLSSHVNLAELKHCSSNWWTNMLAIQNYVNYEEMCYIPSWNIAADIQLFIVGTALMMVWKKNQKLGVYLISLTFLYSVLHTFVRISSNGSSIFMTGFFILDLMNNLQELSAEILDIHAMPFLRVGPYLVGLAAALITNALMEKGCKFSRMQAISLVLVSSAIGLGFQLYGFVFFMVGRQTNPLEVAAFGVLQPILFALPFACLICVNFTTGFGMLTPFFEMKFYIPLGRLAYSIYLVGFVVQSYHIFNQRRIISTFSNIEMHWWLVGDGFFILLFALLFQLICVGPVNGLIDLFVSPYLRKKRKSTPKGKHE